MFSSSSSTNTQRLELQNQLIKTGFGSEDGGKLATVLIKKGISPKKITVDPKTREAIIKHSPLEGIRKLVHRMLGKELKTNPFGLNTEKNRHFLQLTHSVVVLDINTNGHTNVRRVFVDIEQIENKDSEVQQKILELKQEISSLKQKHAQKVPPLQYLAYTAVLEEVLSEYIHLYSYYPSEPGILDKEIDGLAKKQEFLKEGLQE